jgi:hypothetical protein
MTGVGKTDLVRKLVQKLEFQQRFVEIQMDGGSEKGGCDLCILRADAPMPNGMGAESPPEKTRPGPIKHTMQLHSIIIGNGVYVKYLAL